MAYLYIIGSTSTPCYCCEPPAECWLTLGVYADEAEAQGILDDYTSNCVGYYAWDLVTFDTYSISASGTTSLTLSASTGITGGAPGVDVVAKAAILILAAGTFTVGFTAGGTGSDNATTCALDGPESFSDGSMAGSGTFSFEITEPGCYVLTISNTNAAVPGSSESSTIAISTGGVSHLVGGIRAEYTDGPGTSYLVCA